MDVYNKYIEKFSWNINPADSTLLPVIVAVHGTSRKIADKICNTGFAALSSLDQGYYGQGIYFTCHVPYIFPYVAGAENPTMVVVLVFPGNVYPVIENPGGDNSLLGKNIKTGYQSHFVVTTKSGQPATMLDEEIYDELLVVQESQIVPIYLVELKSSNFSILSAEWNREVPKGVGEEEIISENSNQEYRIDAI